MAGKRIKSLTESTTVADTDVIAFDNSALTEANKVTKLNFLKEIQVEVDGKEEVGVASALVSNHQVSTVYNHLTASEKVVIGNTSGTNTNDETSVSIKSKLGITTLSGDNTGDNATNTQYSGLVTTKLDKNFTAETAETVILDADVFPMNKVAGTIKTTPFSLVKSTLKTYNDGLYPLSWNPAKTYVVGDVIYQDLTNGFCYFYVAVSNNLNDNPNSESGAWAYVPSIYYLDVVSGIASISDKFATKKNKLSTVSVVTDTYNILSTDEIIVCNKATAFTVTLPTAVVGQSFDIKNIGVGTVLLEGAGTDTIDNSLNKEILQWTNLKVVCYIANKWIVV